MNANLPPETLRARLAEIDRLLRARDLSGAGILVDELLLSEPTFADAWIVAARHAQMNGDVELMQNRLICALNIAPGSPLIRLMLVESLVHLGEIRRARAEISAMESEASGNASWLGRLCEAWSNCGDYAAAERTARAACALEPRNNAYQFAHASALVALGRMNDAENALNGIIARTPSDFDAWYNRSTLRKQSDDNNHVDAIRNAIANAGHDNPRAFALHFALAKELEDLGEHTESFSALKHGADARRSLMSYRVEGDVNRMGEIARTFDAAWLAQQSEGQTGEGPVFIVGFPRSGTTLVDRILSAHTEVESLGELNDFAFALTLLCRKSFPGKPLVSAAAKLPLVDLGADYVRRIRERGSNVRFLIDKTPANFLYIGLIAAALPDAKIIHLNRHPVDNAFAMFKALFRMGYPYSYSFDDLTKYMRAKDALMAHWRSLLGDRIIDVHYEDIVADQEAQTRRLLDLVGLNWEPACLEFHRNASPSATASAAQVRQPLYRSSVGRWRRYETELAPLIAALGANS